MPTLEEHVRRAWAAFQAGDREETDRQCEIAYSMIVRSQCGRAMKIAPFHRGVLLFDEADPIFDEEPVLDPPIP